MLVIITVLKRFYKFTFALSFSTRRNFLKWIYFSRWHNYLSVTFFQTTYNLALKQPELCIFNKSMNPGSFKLLFLLYFTGRVTCRKCRRCQKITPVFIGGCCQKFCKRSKTLMSYQPSKLFIVIRSMQKSHGTNYGLSGVFVCSFW